MNERSQEQVDKRIASLSYAITIAQTEEEKLQLTVELENVKNFFKSGA